MNVHGVLTLREIKILPVLVSGMAALKKEGIRMSGMEDTCNKSGTAISDAGELAARGVGGHPVSVMKLRSERPIKEKKDKAMVSEF